MELGKLGVWFSLDEMSAPEAAAAANRIEEMGYTTLWMPEARGRNPLVHAGWLLAQTEKLVVATGIANIYNREPGTAVAAQRTLAEQSGSRFLLGLGVSHKMIVEGVRGLSYGPPIASMRTYLDSMANAPDQYGLGGAGAGLDTPVVLAALGPKMLALAGERTQGAHTYFTMPEHTRMARDILGPDSWLCVEQKVVLENDPRIARDLARQAAKFYLQLPNYCNNWRRFGLTDEDFENGGSDRFVDTTFSWGSIASIEQRIKDHFDAGATHVCVQPVHPNGSLGELHWDVLAQLAA